MKTKKLSQYLCTAIACGLASTACGVDSTQVISSMNDGIEGAEITTSDTALPELYAEGEDPDQVDRETEAFMATFDPEAGRGIKYDEDPYEGGTPDPSEKGNWPVLAGWAMTGDLVFQDGSAGDHCSAFGLSCDNEWHIQANDTNITSHADWLNGFGLKADSLGRCGSDVLGGWPSTPNSWYPCAIPYLYPTVAGRQMPWTFSAGTCPASATGREHIRQAILSMITYLELGTTYRFPEATAANGLTPEIYVQCASDLPVGTAARWSPRGALTLRYAAPVEIEEGCESAGYPGSGSNGTEAFYFQRVDMVYTYSASTLNINWTSMFDFLATCTANTTKVRRGIRNILLHEFGHAMTFAHDRVVDVDTGIMEPALDCTESTEFLRGFSEPLRNLMIDFDSRAIGSLSLHDSDVSCLKPFGQ